MKRYTLFSDKRRRAKHSLLLCAALLSGIFCLLFPANAAGTPVIAAGSAAGKPGESVCVDITLTGNPGIVATRIFIQADHSVLRLTKVENGTLFADSRFTSGKDLDAEVFTMLWDDPLARTDMAQDGVLAKLTFEILDNDPAAGIYPITLTYDSHSTFNTDLRTVSFETRDGSIQVQSDGSETPQTGRVRSVTADGMTLLYKGSGRLLPTVTADSGVGYAVAYSGFDRSVISVQTDGKVTALKTGTTDVTVTATDEYGNTAQTTCTVTVEYAWWQVLIRILLLGFLWY